MSNSKYIFGDCIEGMKAYPDNHFDWLIADLQQGNDQVSKIVEKSGGIYGIKNIKRGEYASKEWDKERMTPEYFKEAFRVSKHQIFWCATYYTDLLPCSRGWIVWDKVNGSTHFGDCELAWTSLDQPIRMLVYMWNGHMQGISLADPFTQRGDKSLNEKRIHPTQKPIAFYDWHVKKYIQSGDKVLDTHVGSASSLISYAEHDIEFVGFENDTEHYLESMQRMKSHSLFLQLPEFVNVPDLKKSITL